MEILQDQLFKKKAECVKLQNRLDDKSESLRKIVDYETTTSSLTEDKELNQAMDAQKAINRYYLPLIMYINKDQVVFMCVYVILDIF